MGLSNKRFQGAGLIAILLAIASTSPARAGESVAGALARCGVGRLGLGLSVITQPIPGADILSLNGKLLFDLVQKAGDCQKVHAAISSHVDKVRPVGVAVAVKYAELNRAAFSKTASTQARQTDLAK